MCFIQEGWEIIHVGSLVCVRVYTCVYTHTHPCVISAIVIFLLPSPSFLISMERIQMRCTGWCVWCRNLLRSKLHHSQWVRLSSGRRDHWSRILSMAEHGPWPEILLCRTLFLGEREEWPERSFSQLIFQVDFILL